MAYSPLPWLSFDPMAFLTALDRGTQAGLERARLDASVASDSRRGGGGYGGGSVFDPLEQARAAAINQETTLAKQESDAKEAAFKERGRLISLGVPDTEAGAQSGWDRFQKPSASSLQSPWQTIPLGSGEVVQVDKKTGEVRDVKAAREKADPVKVEKLKSLRRELSGLKSRIGNTKYILAQDEIKADIEQRAQEIAELEAELGMSGDADTTPPAFPPNLPWRGAGSTNAPASGFRIISVE